MNSYVLHIKDQHPISVTFKDKAQGSNFLKEGESILTLSTEKGSMFVSTSSFVALIPQDIGQPATTVETEKEEVE
ncbi:hypothetical protein [Prosthecochloris sp.]|uniref:hypothetical protein n=1 Tax=Prosthecochloris sp. TaxID=290513 RepID=UPI00257D3F4B|nr:hypothetical protein [Prosthecochloris sp.]